MKIAFILRGHIRESLEDSRLKDYVSLLKKIGHSVDLYCHTWHESEAKSSYRSLDRSRLFEVKRSHLTDYFAEHEIKKIWIANDEKIELHGNLEGTLPNSKCPLVAWKRMWAGKHAVVSYLYHNRSYDYDLVVNCRYDLFTTAVCYTPVKNLVKMTAGKSELSLKYPKYYRYLKGVDNYYCGPLNHIYDITSAFHYNLDEIIPKYSIKGVHEELFYKYAVDVGLVK